MRDEIENANVLTEIQSDISFRSDQPLPMWVTNPYLTAATSENTRKAYRSDIKHYEQSGGILPASPEHVINYLQYFATTLNTRTLSRRLIALKHWHQYQGFPDPTSHPLVNKTMTGITRVHGKPKEKAPALLPDDLRKMIETLSQDASLLAIRDNAILQIGYFGALRRSEIVSIHYEHIKWQNEGIEILLPSSKTDQAHVGQYCAIPYGNDVLCPINALEKWLAKSAIKEGAIFRRIAKNQMISSTPLTALSLNRSIASIYSITVFTCFQRPARMMVGMEAFARAALVASPRRKLCGVMFFASKRLASSAERRIM